MKKLFLIIAIIVSSGTIGYQLNKPSRIRITKIFTDERGCTSVQFIEDGREYALDYLTEDEYLKLINK